MSRVGEMLKDLLTVLAFVLGGGALGIGIVGLVGGVLLLALLWPVAGAFLGAVSGWALGLFLGDTILGIAAQLGVTDIAMWELGAFLGFVGGFFKTRVRVVQAATLSPPGRPGRDRQPELVN